MRGNPEETDEIPLQLALQVSTQHTVCLNVQSAQMTTFKILTSDKIKFEFIFETI